MQKMLCSLVGAALALVTTSANAKTTFEVRRLADKLYELTTDGGGYTVKVIASVGQDGLLLVDAGPASMGPDLLEALQRLGAGDPRIVINTHSHAEHTTGNLVVGRRALIIGHPNVRERLRSGLFLFDEFDERSLPRLTVADSLTLHFNGDEIRVRAFPGAHDNSEIMVWFTKARVVCVGPLSNGLHFPSVDSQTGDVRRYAEVVRQVIKQLPDDVKIVPGHGADGTMADYRRFHRMLEETTALVRRELQRGKDLDTLRRDDVLKPWQSFDGGYVDRRAWLKYLVEGIKRDRQAGPRKERPFASIYHALKAGGIEAGVKVWNEMRARQANAFLLDEMVLAAVADKLYDHGRYTEAVRFGELCVSQFPRADKTWICHHLVGFSHEKLGHREAARQSLRRSLELNPQNQEAADKLRQLGK